MCLGNKEIMGMNIQKFMDLKGISRNKLSDDLNISYTTISDWINGKTYPRIDKIELMANYFGIDKSNLVENKSESKLEDKAIRIAAHIDDDVTEEEMKEIIKFINYIKSKHE